MNRKRKPYRKPEGYGKNQRYERPYGCGPVTRYTPDSFYQSEPWYAVRYRALLKYGARCQCCGRSRHENVIIHVDHIKPRSKYPELELDLGNLQVLCHECNAGKRASDVTDWRSPTPSPRPQGSPLATDRDG